MKKKYIINFIIRLNISYLSLKKNLYNFQEISVYELNSNTLIDIFRHSYMFLIKLSFLSKYLYFYNFFKKLFLLTNYKYFDQTNICYNSQLPSKPFIETKKNLRKKIKKLVKFINFLNFLNFLNKTIPIKYNNIRDKRILNRINYAFYKSNRNYILKKRKFFLKKTWYSLVRNNIYSKMCRKNSMEIFKKKNKIIYKKLYETLEDKMNIAIYDCLGLKDKAQLLKRWFLQEKEALIIEKKLVYTKYFYTNDFFFYNNFIFNNTTNTYFNFLKKINKFLVFWKKYSNLQYFFKNIFFLEKIFYNSYSFLKLKTPIFNKNKTNVFIYFSFLKNFLFNKDPVLQFNCLYKYFLSIGKYLVNHFYPDKFFFSFINFIHQKKFNELDKNLNTLLFSKYSYLFKKPYINYMYIFEIFYNVFKYKNINFLVFFLKNLFKNVNFYKHQFLLFYIRCFMKLLELPLFKEFNVNGVYIKFHGKIAKAGNSRRKKFLIQHQVISTAYKNNYIVEKFQLHSFTGVVGCTLILSF